MLRGGHPTLVGIFNFLSHQPCLLRVLSGTLSLILLPRRLSQPLPPRSRLLLCRQQICCRYHPSSQIPLPRPYLLHLGCRLCTCCRAVIGSSYVYLLSVHRPATQRNVQAGGSDSSHGFEHDFFWIIVMHKERESLIMKYCYKPKAPQDLSFRCSRYLSGKCCLHFEYLQRYWTLVSASVYNVLIALIFETISLNRPRAN